MNYTHKQHRVIINQNTNEYSKNCGLWYATIHDSRIGWNVYETASYPTAYDAGKYAVSYVNNRMRVTKNTVTR